MVVTGAQLDLDENMKKSSSVTSYQTTNLAPLTYRWDIKWGYLITFIIWHLFGVYGIYILLCGRIQFQTFVFAVALYFCCGLGASAGAHRLWCHRSYKARLPLRVLLAAFQTMSYQHNIFQWVRDHRVHHKYTDTDADPHNSTRGFFFSHVGWLLIRKHPDSVAKCRQTDMRDVSSDPVVAWQRKHYVWLGPFVTFLLPSVIPCWFWNENFLYSFAVVGVLRYLAVLHGIFFVNSIAHLWGGKPYDKNITPTENLLVSLLSFGEGWHNYHHAFPCDYKNAERSNWMNVSAAFIATSARLGLAYDLKAANPAVVDKRSKRTGDVRR